MFVEKLFDYVGLKGLNMLWKNDFGGRLESNATGVFYSLYWCERTDQFT